MVVTQHSDAHAAPALVATPRVIEAGETSRRCAGDSIGHGAATAAEAAGEGGVRRRVAFAPAETVLEISSAGATAQMCAGRVERRAACEEKLFDGPGTIPTALHPLRFSRRGHLWRPYARSFCPECGRGRLWYRDPHGYGSTSTQPEGALGTICRCKTVSSEEDSGNWHHLQHAFEFHAVPGATCSLQLLDDKLLEAVLAWLCGRRGTREVRMEYQAGAGARAVRALAATCRRGRELTTAMRWVPGLHVDLFPHQVAALNRCCALEARRHSSRVCGGILCDEAGLGKTITALALMCRLRDPAIPRIPLGTKLLGKWPQRFYTLGSHQVNELKLLPRDRRRILMSSKYDPQSGGLQGQRKSTRQVFNTAYDPEAGYTGAGSFTRERGTQIVGPVCRCSLLIVPEELESQWQRELKEKSNLRHRIVLRRDDIKILRRQAEASFSQVPDNITYNFPTPEEVERLDVVVTTMERMGSRAGKRKGTSQNDGMREMSDGLALVHWARVIIDEGHELGGKGLSELAKVLGATLASATWVLSATPNRAGSGHFRQVDSRAMTDFLQPGVVGKEAIVRTPKECIALPTLICRVEWFDFDSARQKELEQCKFGCKHYASEIYRSKMCSNCRSMPIEHRLVGRFAWIASADTQQKVDERNNTIPEWMRLTDDLLLNARTKKADYVVQTLARKHTTPSNFSESSDGNASFSNDRQLRLVGAGAAAAGTARANGTSIGKTIVYSLYNSELYIAKMEMQRTGGWTDAASPYKDDFDALEPHLQRDALHLGYTPESWPNWPVEKLCPDGAPSWDALESRDTRYPGWKKAATTLGLSEANWPPPAFNKEMWLHHRPKFHIVAAGDEAKVGEQMRIVRANALQEFKLDPGIDVLLMDGVATVGHDLSFVSDIICMEAISPREAWDQLISRAYRMGADVRRPITVTTLAYKGSAEDHLVPEYASQTVKSMGISSLSVSACNVDGESINAGHYVPMEDWEEDLEQDSAARQAAVVAIEETLNPARSTPPAPKRRKTAKTRTPRTPRQRISAAASAAAVALPPRIMSHGLVATPGEPPSSDGPMCVLRTPAFLGERTGHQFQLGSQGLGYYPTPQRLRMLLDGQNYMQMEN